MFCIFWHFVSFFDKLEFSELGMQIILKKKKKFATNDAIIFYISSLIFFIWNASIPDVGNQLFYSHFVNRSEPVSEIFEMFTFFSSWSPFFSSIVELLFVATGIWCKYSITQNILFYIFRIKEYAEIWYVIIEIQYF